MRAKGEGTIFQRKDGRWQAQITDPETGDRKTVYGRTKTACLQKKRALEAELEKGRWIKPDKITVSAYMQQWLGKKRNYRAGSRYRREISITKRIDPALGSLLLQKLRPYHIETWISSMIEEGLAPRTIRHHYAPLHAALSDAVKLKIIREHPCIGVELPHIEQKQHNKKQTVLNIDQIQRLLKQLEGHWMQNVVMFAFGTAMRKMEILSAQWSDIDFTTGILTVQHNAVRLPGRFVEGAPKSEAGERVIVLPDFLLDMLKKHRVEQVKHRLAIGDTWQDKDLIFPRDNGGMRHPSVPNPILKTALEKAGLPDIPFHYLRHSTVTLLISKGVPLPVIQALCGHSSIKITADVYGHVGIEMQQNAMNVFNTAWKQEAT